ncbi:MAG: DUF5615 family PIN-like protein [Chloroflexota bacterium]
MRFLIDADLPRSAAQVVRSHGYEALDVRDIGYRSAKDSEIARLSQLEKLCLITGDYDFSNIRNYPPNQYAGIVVLSIPPTATSRYINQLLESFFAQKDLLLQLPGKLAIVEPGRIRLRENRP